MTCNILRWNLVMRIKLYLSKSFDIYIWSHSLYYKRHYHLIEVSSVGRTKNYTKLKNINVKDNGDGVGTVWLKMFDNWGIFLNLIES